ncbi:MAG: hypothetical protein JWQ59_1816 [Cryobacterium sp.]|jgi:hypothetical protein|nr:hypothetical protein [Cryobacterium sp.]
MKVLVATRQTQGTRGDDFSRTVEGELVFDAGPCEGTIRDRDWDCECSIAFCGVATSELTTTAIVADLPIGLKEYQLAFRDGLTRADICRECAREFSHAARMLALRWPVGTIVQRDQMSFTARASR